MPVREVLVCADGKPVKLKPEEKRPANRAGKRVYIDEDRAALRLIWTFFWYSAPETKFPQDPCPAYAAADGRYRPMAGLHLTGETAEKLKDTSCGLRPISETRPGGAKEALIYSTENSPTRLAQSVLL
jgi:hypothetical protein